MVVAGNSPIRYRGVMVSSTFTDLERHRTALIKAVHGQELTAVAMENDSAKADVDVIDSSLQMVRDASAYVCLYWEEIWADAGLSRPEPKQGFHYQA